MTTSQRPIDTQDLNEYVQALKDYVKLEQLYIVVSIV